MLSFHSSQQTRKINQMKPTSISCLALKKAELLNAPKTIELCAQKVVHKNATSSFSQSIEVKV